MFVLWTLMGVPMHHYSFQSVSAMKKIIIAAAILAWAAACQRAIAPSATPVRNTEITNENGQRILAGRASVSAFQLPGYKAWYDQSYQGYTIDSATVQELRPLLKNVSMEIFLGTWCGDSRRETPRMLKILSAAGMDTTGISLVFVDNTANHYKQSPQHEEKGLNIHHVPTFILKKNGEETGRIIESPVISLEKDMLAILSQKNYQPHYQAITYWREKVADRNRRMDEAALQQLQPQLQPMVKHYGEFGAYGHMLFAAGDSTEATNVFRLNTMLYPGNAAVLDTLAEALIKLGRTSEALAVLEKMLLLTPGDTQLKKRIAGLELKKM
jgi:tetratricopeptide (TPR) repeat protein